MSVEETLSAGAAGPAPSAQKPVHGISQTRLRNSRARTLRPRMVRSRTASGASPRGIASSLRFMRHNRVRGNVSRHHRRQRASVIGGIPHFRPIASKRVPPAISALTIRNSGATRKRRPTKRTDGGVTRPRQRLQQKLNRRASLLSSAARPCVQNPASFDRSSELI